MEKIITLSMIVLLFSCSSKKQDKTASFETIYTSYYGGNEEANHLMVDDSRAYEKEVNRLGIKEELDEIPEIDFKKNNVLFLHLGLKNSGGYTIDIEKIEFIDNQLMVYQRISTPLKGENVTMALTNPYCIVKIPKAEKIVIK